jgi:dienelactone hydrolase
MIGRGEDVAVSNLVRCFACSLLLVWLLSAMATRMALADDFRPMADLPPLLEFADGSPVRTADQWPQRREQLRRLLMQYFTGRPPEAVPAVVASEVLETRTAEHDSSTRQRIRVTLDTPNRRSFEMWLWLPPGTGPFPLLLTAPRDYQIPWAQLAVQRGYAVCLYPGVDSHHREPAYPGYDSIWQTFRDEYPQADWTEILTKAWLASRTLDVLLDAERGYPLVVNQVGIIGFSRYGKQAMIAAAMDERFTAVVARSPGSPASCPYRFTSRDTFAEAPADFPSQWFLPSLRQATGREHQLPMDAHGWYALIAPRRLLVHTAYNDGAEPTWAVERAYLAARDVYRLLGDPDHLRIHYRPGAHSPITDEHRRQNMDWFDLAFERGESDPQEFPERLLHHFDWDAWKTQQARADLTIPPRATDGSDARDTTRQAVAWMLGHGPATIPEDDRPPFLTPEESAMMTHDRWAVAEVDRLPVRFGEGVRGNVYFRSDATGPQPVVIWLHPYSYHSGYNEGYGVEGTTVYHRLAQAGFVVLAYDQCGFGMRLLEGTDFYTQHPRWSRLGRMVHDVRRALDFVIEGQGQISPPDAGRNVPEFDGSRVTLLGYSLGGTVALHAAALDPRVAGVASFSGFAPLRTANRDARATGGLARLWQWHALVPKLGLFEGREAEIPYDYEDLLRQIAPRPCLIVAPLRDRNHPVDQVRSSVERANQAWADVPTEAGLTALYPEDVCRFQTAQHRIVLDWLTGTP